MHFQQTHLVNISDCIALHFDAFLCKVFSDGIGAVRSANGRCLKLPEADLYSGTSR